MFRKYSFVAVLILALSFLTITPLASAAEKAEAPDTLILKGSPLGGVKFLHKTHVERTGNKCETCHHPSKPEKPASAPQQACRSCHVKPAPAPMKTVTQAAFHNPAAKSGTCIDCHLKTNAEGKKAPTTCMQCHSKANV